MSGNETIADILAEMRKAVVPMICGRPKIESVTIRDVLQWADRIEAAAERERKTADLRAIHRCHDCERDRPGNAAALREAVVALLSWVDDHCQIGAFDEGSTKEDIRREWDALNAAKDSVRAALAAPVRNVDRFATLDEARQAFQEMRGHRILADVELWDSMDEAGAFARWLFAPAEGGDHA